MTIVKTLRKILLAAILPGICIGGFILGVEGLRNIARFMIWAMILPVFAILNYHADHPGISEDTLRKFQENKPSLTERTIHNFAVLIPLIWGGAFLTALAFILGIALINGARQKYAQRLATLDGEHA